MILICYSYSEFTFSLYLSPVRDDIAAFGRQSSRTRRRSSEPVLTTGLCDGSDVILVFNDGL